MDQQLPKVLAVCINAWRTDATAHTLMNIFSCWKPERLSMLYTRSDMPYTNVCDRFFQISENDVLRSVFKPWVKTGREVYNTEKMSSSEVAKEHARYAKAHKRHSMFLSLCRETVWWLGHWKSKEMRNFIDEVNPDLIFVPVYPVVYMGWIQRYVIRRTNKPFVCYMADDNYSYSSCKGILSYFHRFLLRQQVRWLSTHCKEMFVIVDKEKEETDRLFNTNSVILTKGIDFRTKPFSKKTVNAPIKFVYTGSLIIGRSSTLASLADAINSININGIKATLDIYSADQVEPSLEARLNKGGSKLRGFIPRDKVNEVQREADVVVFAEALHGKDANIARLSFSTKITDYLSNGKCVLAIGKQSIAPIDYFVRNDSALVASTEGEIYSQVQRIIDSPDLITEYAEKAYMCAKKNHDKEMMDRRFVDTMISASK